MGLSLGEYSALCFAGAMSFEDGVKVTKARGEAMQAAADLTESGMASVIGGFTLFLIRVRSRASSPELQSYQCEVGYVSSEHEFYSLPPHWCQRR